MEDNGNYHGDIRNMIQHFISAFDGTIVKRFNKSRSPVDQIKVNYLYGVKSPTLYDKVGQADVVKLPIVAVRVTGMKRDSSRIRNKEELLRYKDKDGTYITLEAIPWNISIEMTILCRYQEDLDQIITNFAVNTNPYIVYKSREPISNRDLRIEVVWDGDAAITYPGDEQTPKDYPHRITASANFIIKGYLFKTDIPEEKTICHIHDDIIITDRFFCDYDALVAYSLSCARIENIIEGAPNIQFVNPYYVKTGESPTIVIDGEGFNTTFAVFVSGNRDMYPQQVDFYPGSAHGNNDIFHGVVVPEFKIDSYNELSFKLPPPSAYGLIDIIAVNQCGYGQLTVDANRCNRVINPYPITLPEHYSWTVEQFPFLNGVIVQNDMNPGTVIDCNLDIIEFNREDCDRDAAIESIRDIMTTCNISISDLL